MTRTKDTAWIAGAGVLALLVLAASYFLLIGPKRAEAADLATQKVSVEQNNAAIVQQTALLKAQFATLGQQKAELAAIRSTLPASADVPALLRQLSDYAASSGVTVTAVTPGTAAAFNGAGAAGTADASSGIVSIPLVVTAQGSFAQTELFVKSLQADMQRYFSVSDVVVARGEDQASTTGNTLTSTVTGQIFVIKDTASPAAASTTATQTAAVPSSEGTR